MELQQVLRSAEEYLLTSEAAEVALGWRIRLWSAINRAFPDDALWRRSILAYGVARRTLPAWDRLSEQIEPRRRSLPHHLIANCRDLILGEITVAQAQDYDLYNDIEYSMGLFDDLGPGVWCLPAARAAIQCAASCEEAMCQEFFYDRFWEPDFLQVAREEDDGWAGWDTHFWASCVAGGYPDLPGFDPERRRHFWLRWLHEDVPAVLGSGENARRLLEE